ncbi:acetyltransferase (GNAT) family protein [Thermosporothrix hazakensis]|jgi:ribosomal protein S18 acetylase RimI-like enzyme|uniref:Acetyltransferase (GNAT) family protein n=2 Tax=Thermosporothrix TaxID=768650 RepID=A0A326TZX0_THEHA|nr:GNAT family N-acetyltransferase [Thermosporothrix hazakensis]PZW23382.1 acetyltransferase (GNAT) family protein [Thermosporothrix hazakensis]BBH89727.1 hypothetical protein KTC_44780 [Thermosporothrix sp. COM3]GCE47916.1 hypothetical protein KTH_27850 [Thermosporothrix hazakensis]
MSIEIVTLTTEAELIPFQEQLRQVYYRAFSLPPHNESLADAQHFVSRQIVHHSKNEHFRFCIARSLETGTLLGFIYGHTTKKGLWWHDQVAPYLSEAQYQQWFSNGYEIVTFGVDPAAQRQGIGGMLHDTILYGLPHRTAILSTQHENLPARRFYQKRGWQIILHDFYFSGNPLPYVILGRAL